MPRYQPDDPRIIHGASAARPEWLRVVAPHGDNYQRIEATGARAATAYSM